MISQGQERELYKLSRSEYLLWLSCCHLLFRCFFRVFSCLLLLLPLQPLLCTVARWIFFFETEVSSCHFLLKTFKCVPIHSLYLSPVSSGPALAPAPTFSSLSSALWPPSRSFITLCSFLPQDLCTCSHCYLEYAFLMLLAWTTHAPPTDCNRTFTFSGMFPPASSGSSLGSLLWPCPSSCTNCHCVLSCVCVWFCLVLMSVSLLECELREDKHLVCSAHHHVPTASTEPGTERALDTFEGTMVPAAPWRPETACFGPGGVCGCRC